jgi:hypothetical protein
MRGATNRQRPRARSQVMSCGPAVRAEPLAPRRRAVESRQTTRPVLSLVFVTAEQLKQHRDPRDCGHDPHRSPEAGGAGAAGAFTVYASVLRPRIQWLGTSNEERTATYPGDDLIPSGRRYGAMATTIAAPPECVWPWLVQMGCDRAGFYSFDRLDNGGRPSADHIHAQWLNLREGDSIASVADASRWFDVALLAPEQALVPRASLTVPAARNFDPADGLPRVQRQHLGLLLAADRRRAHPAGRDRQGAWKAARTHRRLQLAVLGPRALGDAAQAVRRPTPPCRVPAQRPRRRAGECRMKRWATRLHAWVYRRSGGRVLGRIGGQPVLLLQTTGRRSGRPRTTPLQYVAHAEGFLVVAANHGAAAPAGLVPQPLRQSMGARSGRGTELRCGDAGGRRRRAYGALAPTERCQPPLARGPDQGRAAAATACPDADETARSGPTLTSYGGRHGPALLA